MKHLSPLLVLPVLGIAHVSSAKLRACPLLGQQYPPPVQISTESDFQSAIKALESELSKSVGKFPFKDTTFSIGMFSVAEDTLWQYHHAGASLSKGNKSITPTVDGDSVYQIGSISKLFTVYLWLINQGDILFSHSIAEYLPELLDGRASWNSLTPIWEEITIGDIAGQTGGLARDYGLEDIAAPHFATLGLPATLKPAFPQLPLNEVPKCDYLTPNMSLVVCSDNEYLRGVATESPLFSAAYTPVYSNEGFALMGLALASIEGTTLESIFEQSFVSALGLTGTYYSTPRGVTAHDIIPGNPLRAGWTLDFGPFAAAGGFFSSVNDFAKIGQSILSSSLLSRAQTSRWLKPTSFVEAFDQGVGRPWEIYRLKIHGQSIDVYSKSGSYDLYHAFFAVIPAYDIGLTILTAEDSGSGASSSVRDELPATILDAVLPVIDDIARMQASTNFAGTYTSSETNSSLTLETSKSGGLEVTAWVNNGVDLFADLFGLFPNINYRIVPNALFEGNQVGFTSYYQSATSASANGNWLLTCQGWFAVDEITFGNIPLGQMVFQVDATGKAVSVETRALRTTLQKES